MFSQPVRDHMAYPFLKRSFFNPSFPFHTELADIMHLSLDARLIRSKGGTTMPLKGKLIIAFCGFLLSGTIPVHAQLEGGQADATRILNGMPPDV